jgi:predicted amidophosphoribosyltransferase
MTTVGVSGVCHRLGVTLRGVVGDLADALFPARCPGCGARGRPLCDGCRATLTVAPRAAPPPPLGWWTACFAYEGVARELIARAKYRDERHALRFAVPLLAVAAASAPLPVAVITWIPASRARARAHGVDHGELLARAVAEELGLPVRRLLTRAPGPAQTGRDASARRQGPCLEAVGDPRPGPVLVVDDVATTGGSLAAAARVLRAAGASSVFAATLARTRRPGDGARTAAYTFPTAAEPRMA